MSVPVDRWGRGRLAYHRAVVAVAARLARCSGDPQHSSKLSPPEAPRLVSDSRTVVDTHPGLWTDLTGAGHASGEMGINSMSDSVLAGRRP